MLQARSLASIAVAVAMASLLPSATLQAQNSNSNTSSSNTSSSNTSAANDYRTTLQLYCVGCHSGPTPFAGLNLEPLDFANLEANGEIWEKLIRKLRARQMPPAGMPRPDDATLEALVKSVESGRAQMEAAKTSPGTT